MGQCWRQKGQDLLTSEWPVELLNVRLEIMNTFILFKVSASSESMYDDAYTLQHVTSEDVHNFNYVAGMVPFLFNLIQDVRERWRLKVKNQKIGEVVY